jgi:hypothetical protein
MSKYCAVFRFFARTANRILRAFLIDEDAILALPESAARELREMICQQFGEDAEAMTFLHDFYPRLVTAQ